MVQDDKPCIAVSLSQNAETHAQWQVDSTTIDDENRSYSLRRLVHNQDWHGSLRRSPFSWSGSERTRRTRVTTSMLKRSLKPTFRSAAESKAYSGWFSRRPRTRAGRSLLCDGLPIWAVLSEKSCGAAELMKAPSGGWSIYQSAACPTSARRRSSPPACQGKRGSRCPMRETLERSGYC